MIPDNYSQWEEHERQAEARLAMCPLCSFCGEHIQDEFAYNINGELICQNCMESNFKVYVED